jgi:dolichol-phosphate mannosyltransferase
MILIAPLFAVLSIYMSTDPPLLFFWSLCCLWLESATASRRWTAWLGAGLALGLALMSKFLALLMLPAVGLYLLGSRRPAEWSRWLAAGALALLVTVPLWLWNADNDWATFRFNFEARHETRDMSLLHPLEYLLGAMVALSPGLLVAAVRAVWWGFTTWRRERQPAYWFLVAMAATPLLGFFLVSLRRQVGLHWPAVGYLSAIILLALAWGADTPWARRRWVTWSFWFCVGLTAIAHLAPHVPPSWLRTSLAWTGRQSIRVSAINEVYGWHELGREVARVRAELAADAGPGQAPFVISNQYGLASSIAFYDPEHGYPHIWSEPLNHGQSYHHWADFPSLRGQDALFVAKRHIEAWLPSLRQHFRRVDPPEELSISVDGEEVRSFLLVRCHEFDGRAPQFE